MQKYTVTKHTELRFSVIYFCFGTTLENDESLGFDKDWGEETGKPQNRRQKEEDSYLKDMPAGSRR